MIYVDTVYTYVYSYAFSEFLSKQCQNHYIINCTRVVCYGNIGYVMEIYRTYST